MSKKHQPRNIRRAIRNKEDIYNDLRYSFLIKKKDEKFIQECIKNRDPRAVLAKELVSFLREADDLGVMDIQSPKERKALFRIFFAELDFLLTVEQEYAKQFYSPEDEKDDKDEKEKETKTEKEVE